MHNDEDNDLRGLFGTLRETEKEGTPAFGALWSRAQKEAAGAGVYMSATGMHRGVLVRRLAWGGSLLAAAAAAALILLPTRGTSDAEFIQVVQSFSANPSSGAWRSPTDGLLDVPGSEVLNTIPSLGSRKWILEPSTNRRRNEL